MAGELSHHFDYPMQIALGPVTQAVFSPVLFDTDVGDTVLGQFGPSQVVKGFKSLDRTQASVEISQIFRGRLRADLVVVSADVAWTRIHDIPDPGVTPLTSDDEDSWGYRLKVVAQYSGLFGGINLQPFASFTHDVNGTTPAPVSTFVEDRKSLTLGVRADYIHRIAVELRYTGFFHGGRANQLRDRDFLQFQVSYSL